MQNSLHTIQSNTQTPISKIFKLRRNVKRIDRYEQLSAEAIVTSLETALNARTPVTIQVNNSLLSEDVTNYSGYLIQTGTGRLFLTQPFSSEMQEIFPGAIRNILFNHDAA